MVKLLEPIQQFSVIMELQTRPCFPFEGYHLLDTIFHNQVLRLASKDTTAEAMTLAEKFSQAFFDKVISDLLLDGL